MGENFTDFYRFLPLPQNFAPHLLPLIDSLRFASLESRRNTSILYKSYSHPDKWRVLAVYGGFWRVIFLCAKVFISFKWCSALAVITWRYRQTKQQNRNIYRRWQQTWPVGDDQTWPNVTKDDRKWKFAVFGCPEPPKKSARCQRTNLSWLWRLT